MPDDSILRNRVSCAIEAGELPSRLPDKLLAGVATGGRCAVCGESTKGGVEMELLFDQDDPAVGKTYYAHPRCFLALEREIRALAGRRLPLESEAVTDASLPDTLVHRNAT
jgi:hypothetical protein